jgi:hypothetical protein
MRILACKALFAFSLATIAGAAPLANPLISIDENGFGTIQFPGGPSLNPTGVLMPDPGPGGLSSALTYDLAGPPALVSGDVLVQELIGAELILSEIIRFNPAGTGSDAYPASLVFYSDLGDGIDSLADTGFPAGRYTNTATALEIGAEGSNGFSYTPTANQPGFVPGFDVTYSVTSDSSSVPEPASISLFAIAGGLFAAGKRWLKRA